MPSDDTEAAPRSRGEAKVARLEAKVERARQRQLQAQHDTAADAPPTLRARIHRAALIPTAGLLIVVVVLAAYASSLRSDNRRLDDLNAARTAAVQRASQAVADFGSYDYRHLDQDFAKVLAQLTPKFRSTYAHVTKELKSTIIAAEAVSTAQIKGIGVVSAGVSQATVIIFLDQTVTGRTSKTPQIDRNRLRLNLLKQRDGSWLVSKLSLV